MAKKESPKANEDKYAKIEDSWAQQAPDAAFGGMTLVQFRTRIKPSKDTRTTVKSLEDQLNVAQNNRETADVDTMAAVDLVVKGVVGDPTFGDDSALYEGMGYIRKSQRKSGLTRKKKGNGTSGTP